MLSVKQGGLSSIFWVFGITRRGIKPRSPEPLVYTLHIRPKATGLGVVAIKKGAFGSPSTMVANFIYMYKYNTVKRTNPPNKQIFSSNS